VVSKTQLLLPSILPLRFATLGSRIVTNTDHDLVEVAQALLLLIPVAISTSWVKGHYTGADRQYQHDLNDEADKLAGQYQGWQVPHHTIRQPLPPPNYSIRLLHDSSVLTSRIRSTVVDSLHSGPIESHIMRKANWSPQVFRKVHWDAHERAFRRLHRYAQHSTAKLVHGLVNTNRQNHLYYGHSSLCPICNSEEETLSHVFSCAAPAAASHRLKSLEDLRKTLISISTPEPVVAAIQHGFQQWCQETSRQHARALTAGSLRGPDAVLTSAFHEQFRDIGWYQLCLGRVSTKWASAVSQYHPNPLQDGGLQWTSIFIAALWSFSTSMWKHRNEVVHGATVEEQTQWQLTQLRSQITSYYAKYAENPALVLPRHRCLFTSRTEEERHQSSYDSMSAWLRSVDEALLVVQHHDAHLREMSRVFFPQVPFTEIVSATDSTYSDHTSLDTDDTSLDSTVATTVTTHTSYSTSSSGIHCLHYDSDDDSYSSDTARCHQQLVIDTSGDAPDQCLSHDDDDVFAVASGSSGFSTFLSSDTPSTSCDVH
jgi:hypothetical protein